MRLAQVDEHDDARFRGHAEAGDEAHLHGHAEVDSPNSQRKKTPPTRASGTHIIISTASDKVVVGQVEDDEDHQGDGREDDLHGLSGADLVLELAAPLRGTFPAAA